MIYSWALNELKLARAIGLSDNKTEEEIKEIYLSIGGKVALEEIKEVKPVAEEEKVEVTPAESTPQDVTEDAGETEVGIPPEGIGEAPSIEEPVRDEEVESAEPVSTDDTSI